MLNFFIAGTEQVDSYVLSTDKFNSDDSVWLEYQMAKDLVSPRENDVINRIVAQMVPGRMAGILKVFPGMPLETVAEHLLRHPPIFIPGIHQMVYQDIVQTLGDDLPLASWFEERMTLRKKEKQYKLLWETAQFHIQEGEFESAQAPLEQLLGEVIAEGYYWICLDYIKVSMALGQNDRALTVAKRLQQMSPALPFAYRAEIEITNPGGDQLKEIISRARKYMPDFVN
jgi:hypothetical protein